VLVPASVTAPEVAHAPLVDIPRYPSGYKHRAAVWAMVKSVSSQARPHIRSIGFHEMLWNRGSFITDDVRAEGKITMNRAMQIRSTGP
jgi:hypothetical protein